MSGELMPNSDLFDIVYQDINYYPEPTKFLFSRLPHRLDGSFMLDVGCGNGRNSLELLRRGAVVHATDPSAVGVGALAKHAEQAGLTSSLRSTTEDVTTLRLPPLDGVVLSTVLDHMTRAEALRVLAFIKPALKPDCWVYASVFTTSDPGNTGDSRSETNDGVVTYWEDQGFADLLAESMDCVVDSTEIAWKDDISHGPPHQHHMVKTLVIRGRPHLL